MTDNYLTRLMFSMMPQLLLRVGDMVNRVSFFIGVTMCSSAKTYPTRLTIVTLEIRITVFACLLSDEGCDSFTRHLDLELAPKKTNKRVKKQ